MDFCFSFLFSIALGAPLGLLLELQKPCFFLFNFICCLNSKYLFYFSILFSHFCGMSFLGWINVFFLFLSSIGLGAPLGLLLKLQKSFSTFQF